VFSTRQVLPLRIYEQLIRKCFTILSLQGDKAFDVTLGLHTYFDVSSVKNVVVKGPFQGQTFVDRIAGSESTYPRSYN
jgi:D-hexose-6-phosphate mutarotase